jgi:hypothetical protein
LLIKALFSNFRLKIKIEKMMRSQKYGNSKVRFS